ncbi:hypothetical protein D6829_02450 [Candidatus Pacearchaeota archaeon]|nr:MAG: hypothetical protein D6829_02450 [Candidatus Pacearchaeota archaeon]
MKKALLLILILMVSGSVIGLEGTHIVSNSEDWRDVYSIMLYARLSGRQGSFLTSTRHGPILLKDIPKGNSIGIVSSSEKPFVVGYSSMVQSEGFSNVNEIEVDNANLELIEEPEVQNIKNFIIVSDAYGYNAIAVAPYALLTKSWVFFANRVNIAEIDAFLSRRNPNKILIYGYVDEEVKDALEKYNPETINSGDRFEDNIEIVKKFMSIKNEKQITLTNGEFFEQAFLSDRYPILFTGRQNVPDKIADYLKSSDIKVGVLVGNELIQAATNIRRTTGISVMVKFARSARIPTGGVSQVQGLDLFPMPSPQLSLSVQSVKFNKISSQLEVTYQSKSNVPLYLKGTITLKAGSRKQRVGDAEPVYLAPNDFKTLSYPGIDLGSDPESAEIFTLFGEVPTSMDRQLQVTLNVSVTNVLDKCEIEVDKVKYVKQDESFYVYVENTGPVNCFVDIEFEKLKINGLSQIVGTDGSVEVSAGSSKKIPVKQRMTEKDLESNPFVNVIAYYGEREDSLVHQFKGKFKLDVDILNTLTFSIIVIAIVLVVLLIVVFVIKRRDEDW